MRFTIAPPGICGHGGITTSFPRRRAEGLRFIGERIYEDNRPTGDDRNCYVAASLAVAAEDAADDGPDGGTDPIRECRGSR